MDQPTCPQDSLDAGFGSLRLDRRVALVTGGTQGIGRDIAELLKRRGATVVVTGRNKDRGGAVSRELGVEFFASDVTEDASRQALASHIVDTFGGLDILVNNAGGMGMPTKIAQTTSEGFDETVGVHLKAPWMMMALLLPLFRQGGNIVNISSLAGHRVGATSTAYAVAKAAMLHLTRCAAAEFGEAGIRVNSVSPGFIPTAIHAQMLGPDDPRAEKFIAGLSKIFLQRQALNRLGTPCDIANLVAFLASDAAGFISGADIVADGSLMWGRADLI